MRRILFHALIGLTIGLAGCAGNVRQNAVDVSLATTSLVLLDQAHDQARLAVRALQPRLTDGERAIVQHVSEQLDAIRVTVRRMVEGEGGLAGVLDDLHQVRLIWSTARIAYAGGYTVVMAHWDELTPIARRQLGFYHDQALATDEAIQRILANPGNADAMRALSDALTIGAAAAKVVMLL